MIEIREIQVDEVKEILKIFDEYDRPKAPWPCDNEIENIFKRIKSSNGYVLAAFENDTVLGTCSLYVCPSFNWSGRSFAIIENVIVTSKERNRGIGKLLLENATAIAENKGCYKVALMTGSKKDSVHKFYESAGFKANKTGYQIRFNA